MVFTLSFNIAVSRDILQHWQWQSVGYGPVKAVKICFRTSNLTGLVKVLDCTSALSWRLKIWNSTSTLLLCLNCQRPDVPLPHFRSALTAKDLNFFVRTFVLHWLPKMWSSASALPLCLDCQICEVLLPHFRSVLTGKDLKFRFPHLFYQDFQRWEVPLPHFISAWTSKDLQISFLHFRSILTAKDLKIGFSTNTLPSLPNMGSSASTFPFCLDCKRSVVSHFRSAFIPKDVNALLLCLDCQSSASSVPL